MVMNVERRRKWVSESHTLTTRLKFCVFDKFFFVRAKKGEKCFELLMRSAMRRKNVLMEEKSEI
jgi:hypothetical protein